ncbi:MAG: HGGxSTG domain-containing protein [Tateyamaria sp.]|uniref:HGGxSTG domain-containing protein n=1 Tax=Tateyamaria sp. TaxID=1929288 RepID=UPI0032DC38FF
MPQIASQRRAQAQRYRARCAATNRKGTPCRLLSEPGRRRCKFHGGRSTGPRTAEGRARIAEAQRKRWQAWRVKQTPIKPETPEMTR